MNNSEFQAWAQLNTSSQVLWICDAVLVFVAVAAVAAAVHHFLLKVRGGEPKLLLGKAPTVGLYVAAGTLALWVYSRWGEVNHFPSQTMNEVLTIFTFALVLSMIVLHHALGVQRRGPGWAILDDVLILIIVGACFLIHGHIRGLVTAHRQTKRPLR